MSFQLIPNSVILDDLERRNSPYRRVISPNAVAFGADYVKVVEDTSVLSARDLRSFEIRLDFESNFRFGIRFVVMIRFEIFESSAPSIILCKETIGGG